MIRRQWIGGNWKMNGTVDFITELLNSLSSKLDDFLLADVTIFPSFVYLELVNALLGESVIKLGAQNLSQHEVGAYTGEVSANMLKEVGCQYVLVGHSERRQLFGESSDLVGQKYAIALNNGLIPVLCVGETKEQREAGETQQIILEQINAVTAHVGLASLLKGIVAYEPVWAIGTGLTATPEQAQEVHEFIRKSIALEDEFVAENLCIVYGGSVKGSNAAELFAMPDIDGGLIGGASLKAEEFITICQSVKKKS